jgi:hypothetical protein
MSPNALSSNTSGLLRVGGVPNVLITKLPESPLKATLVSVVSPVLLTNAIGPWSPALPPGATVLDVDSPELQPARPIKANPSIAVAAFVMTIV